jgi:hypothetical protein
VQDSIGLGWRDVFRRTFEAILAGHRASPGVHADEMWGQLKRPSNRGYVGEVECSIPSCPAEDWLTLFGADPKKAGRWLDRQIGRDINLIRQAVRAAKKIRAPGC